MHENAHLISPIPSVQYIYLSIYQCRGCPRCVMVKVMDCRILVSELVFQSFYYVHFRGNTLRKGMIPFILPAMG